MKRLVVILLTMLLLLCCSCANEREYSLLGKTLDITFEDGKASARGILTVGDGFIEFLPETPSGLTIRITENGGSVSWGKLTFDKDIIPSSRLLPLFEALQNNAFTVTFGSENHPDTIEGDGFKITIHKEISTK